MDSLKDMDITSEEVEKFQNALKDEKFRKLFVEYAEEISNPENRKLYEEEITKMEAARGMDAEFIYPVPGFVIKTSVNGDKKAFINVCKNDKIEKASSTTTCRINAQGVETKGDQWSMPYSLSEGRDDLDKSGAVCRVYDVVFHPDTFTAAEKDPRLKQMMIDTSMNGIESQCNIKLDKPNVKEMKKLKFKGTPVATILRTKAKKDEKEPTIIEDGVAALNLKYPYDNQNQSSKPEKHKRKNEPTSKATWTVPEYEIIHRGVFDMQNFTNAPDSMTSTRPKELIIKIKLPLLDSAANVDLEVHERQLVVESVKPGAYKLDLSLPYPVNDDCGSAKFDKSKRCLVVTLPVLPSKVLDMPSFAPAKSEPLIQEIAEPSDKKSSCDVDTSKTEESCAVDEINVEDNVTESEIVDDHIAMMIGKEEKDNDVSPVHPTFTFTQDDEFVHLVIDACGVQPAAVTYHLPALQDGFSIKITDAVTPGGLVEYSLYLKFTNGCTISKDVLLDVSAENVVVALEKQPSSKGLWEMFMAGIDQNSLQEKKFVTEENVKMVFDEDNQSSVFDEECPDDVVFNVTTLDQDNMHVQVNMVGSADKMTGAEDAKLESAASDSKVDYAGDSKDDTEEDCKSENEVANLATAWQNLDLDGCNGSSSPPSTPTSPSSLKSLIRRNRRRAHKSVSFCEEVEVEVLVKKGKGKRGQQPKMKRALSYEKIKDNSWNSYSDSEFVLNSENIKVNILKARDVGQNKRRNRRAQKYNLARNSDSEAVDCKGEALWERPKVKLSKKQMRRQKRLNNRLGKQTSESASERSETSEEEGAGKEKEVGAYGQSKTSKEDGSGSAEELDEGVNEPFGTSEEEVHLNVDKPYSSNKNSEHVNNNNVEAKSQVESVDDDDDVNKPLELQDHTTTSAVNFSNILIHELD